MELLRFEVYSVLVCALEWCIIQGSKEDILIYVFNFFEILKKEKKMKMGEGDE